MAMPTNEFPPVSWWQPRMGRREKDLICEVIDSHFPNDGSYTEAFEARVAELCGTQYAVAATSGTAAIFLALAAHGVGAGHEVIVPDITFIATANAVSLTGARPVLVDVREDLMIDPAAVRRAITPQTKAIVPVHVSGRPAAIYELVQIAAAHGIAVIEDAAEALGSRLKGRHLGSIADAGCFSFTANKTITTGQGGMVVTNNADVHRRLRELKDQGRPVRGTGGDDIHHSVGYNFKLTNIQGAMGLAQLEDLERRLDHLRMVYEVYHRKLEGSARVRIMDFDVANGIRPQWVDALVEDRDDLVRYLSERNVQTRNFWFPLHTQAPYAGGDRAFPNSTRLVPKALWLPSSYTMSEGDVERVAGYIAAWADRRVMVTA